MAGGLVAPAVFAAIAGAVLAFGTLGVLDASGPAEREEATVEARGQHVDRAVGHRYDLVLRTASGERFEVDSADAGFDLEPGLPVSLEVSRVWGSVQAVEAGGRRFPTGNSPVGVGIFVLMVAAMPLFLTLITAARTGRPALAALSAAAGLAAGALLVVLLF
jgi:hypothetical protein